jgi:hypothetical protein
MHHRRLKPFLASEFKKLAISLTNVYIDGFGAGNNQDHELGSSELDSKIEITGEPSQVPSQSLTQNMTRDLTCPDPDPTNTASLF